MSSRVLKNSFNYPLSPFLWLRSAQALARNGKQLCQRGTLRFWALRSLVTSLHRSIPALAIAALAGLLALTACAQDTQPEATSTSQLTRLVVLLSDFGDADHRTPSIKGYIYSTNPDVHLVDGAHDLPAFDVPTAAYVIEATAKTFPSDTIFVGAVAPGGVDRYLVATANNGQVFVVPDNGLATYIARDLGMRSVHHVTNQELFDGPIVELSTREVLGVTAAHVSAGTAPADFGPQVTDMRMLNVPEASLQGDTLMGAVVFVDGFGNSLTNIPRDLVDQLGLSPGDAVQITTPAGEVKAAFGTQYGDVVRGDPVVLMNSLGVLELAINRGSFSAAHDVQAGSAVQVAKTSG